MNTIFITYFWMMDILEQFNQHIEENRLVAKEEKVLLAVSGGKDSMLMLWLFHQSGYTIEIAHCNFQLRGEASNRDEALVRKYAADIGIPIHVQTFDTESYAAKHKISIQMAARELRYNWFEALRQDRSCSCIAIAQHKNDHVETVIWNMVRGTGLRGLTGIKGKRDQIIRPLLFLEAKRVAQLVQEHKIPFMVDMSNFSTKYSRNKIRLDIIPEFEKMNPNFIAVMEDNIQRFEEAIDVLDDFVSELRTKLFIAREEDTWLIEKKAIQDKKIGLLYLLFEPYGFMKSTLQSMLDVMHAESGRIFESADYAILSDRTQLVLKKKSPEPHQVWIPQEYAVVVPWGKFHLDCTIEADCTIEHNPMIAKLDRDLLVYPLSVRSWEEGDTFKPLGMKGRKKISDLFIQLKVNLFDKKDTAIVVNGNGDILWVAGIQIDDRYKITKKTKKVLKLVLHKR